MPDMKLNSRILL